MRSNWLSMSILYVTIILMLYVSVIRDDAVEVEDIKTTQNTINEVASVATMQTVNDFETYEPTVEEKIITVCKSYGIDSNMAIAIAKLETGHFTSNAYIYSNNVGGLMTFSNGKYVLCEYNTIEDGIDAFVQTIHNLGADDLNKLAESYCPHNPTGWVNEVKKLM